MKKLVSFLVSTTLLAAGLLAGDQAAFAAPAALTFNLSNRAVSGSTVNPDFTIVCYDDGSVSNGLYAVTGLSGSGTNGAIVGTPVERYTGNSYYTAGSFSVTYPSVSVATNVTITLSATITGDRCNTPVSFSTNTTVYPSGPPPALSFEVGTGDRVMQAAPNTEWPDWTDWEYEYSRSGGAWQSAMGIVLLNVVSGEQVTFRSRLKNAFGWGDWAYASAVGCASNDSIPRPSGLSVIVSGTSATVSFSHSLSNCNLAYVQGYRVSFTPQGSGATLTGEGLSSGITVSGLKPGGKYDVSVATITGGNFHWNAPPSFASQISIPGGESEGSISTGNKDVSDSVEIKAPVVISETKPNNYSLQLNDIKASSLNAAAKKALDSAIKEVTQSESITTVTCQVVYTTNALKTKLTKLAKDACSRVKKLAPTSKVAFTYKKAKVSSLKLAIKSKSK